MHFHTFASSRGATITCLVGRSCTKCRLLEQFAAPVEICIVDELVGNTRQQAVIIHGHSVTGIEPVVCVMRTRTRRQGIWMSRKIGNAIWCQLESAMFCTHLSHFGYAVHLLPKRGFSYRACDEEMPKPQLVLTLLKIIS